MEVKDMLTALENG